MKIYILLILMVAVALAANNTTDDIGVHKKKPTPFTHWSWVWALGCLLAVLAIREYVKRQAYAKAEINVMDEFRSREGVYRIEDYEADLKNGALQTCPKDEDGLIQLKLAQRTKLNHDTYNFKFEFPQKDMEFGLPIGGHVFFYATVKDPETGKDKEIARKYTPTSPVHQKGYVEFVIKVYHAGVHPKFPHGGLMTQYLEKMPVGSYLKMEGPKGKLKYVGCGNFYISKKYQIKKNIGMIAGGSGITPMFQIIQAVVKNKDKVKLTLLFGNKSEKDILIREELEQLQEDYPSHFKLHYIIDKADHPDSWNHSTGYITKELLENIMPKPSEDTLILT